MAEVNYIGNIITPEGLKPDPKNITAIENMPNPRDHQSMLRLLGMVKYLSAYIPHESIITTPMRALLCKDVTWQWEHEHDRAPGASQGYISQCTSATILQRKEGCHITTRRKSAWTFMLPAGMLKVSVDFEHACYKRANQLLKPRALSPTLKLIMHR